MEDVKYQNGEYEERYIKINAFEGTKLEYFDPNDNHRVLGVERSFPIWEKTYSLKELLKGEK